MPEDSFWRDIHLTDRVLKLRQDYFRAVPEICIERPILVTNYGLQHHLFDQERISILDKAKTYGRVLPRARRSSGTRGLVGRTKRVDWSRLTWIGSTRLCLLARRPASSRVFLSSRSSWHQRYGRNSGRSPHAKAIPIT
jgi:hypothetical protein